MKEQWGCTKPLERPLVLLDSCTVCGGNSPECSACKGTGRERICSCPVLFLMKLGHEFLGAWSLFRKGFLPSYPPVIDEQNNWFIEAVLLMESEIAQYENEEAKRLQRKAKS